MKTTTPTDFKHLAKPRKSNHKFVGTKQARQNEAAFHALLDKAEQRPQTN